MKTILTRTVGSALALGLSLAVVSPARAALVAHWTFDDATPVSDLAFDNVGTNNGGGTVSGLNAATSEIIGAGAADFGTQNASDGYFNLTSVGDFSLTGSNTGTTVAFWYKAPASQKVAANRLPVHMFNTGNSTSLSIELNDGTPRLFVRQSDGSKFVRATGTTDIFDDTWHHVAVTYNSSAGTATVYVDGKFDANATNVNVGSTLAFTNGRVGTHALDANLNLDIGGAMDELGIWNSLTSHKEIALIHGLGYFTGIDLADGGIAAVLAAFDSQGTGTAGGYDWTYQTGLSGGVGTIGGSIANANAFIVLDASGNGVQVIPEPASLLLFGCGSLLVSCRRNSGRR